MSLQAVKNYLEEFGVSERVQTFEVSSATVELAAMALSVEGARIAKTLSFITKEGCILIVAAGDVKIDNSKFKHTFGTKAKMPPFDEVEQYTGHPAGGVCPFAVKEGVQVYLDESLKRFATVFPAAGTGNSAIELTCDELFEFSRAVAWVDIGKLPEAPAAQ